MKIQIFLEYSNTFNMKISEFIDYSTNMCWNYLCITLLKLFK
jgi:hypothetical protein